VKFEWRRLALTIAEKTKKEELDVTDHDAEWRSMAPRVHRVIGSRRLLRSLLGVPHTTGTESQLNTPADAPPPRCHRRNNLIIKSVSVWPTNRRPNGSRDLTDVSPSPGLFILYRIPSFTVAKLYWLDHSIDCKYRNKLKYMVADWQFSLVVVFLVADSLQPTSASVSWEADPLASYIRGQIAGPSSFRNCCIKQCFFFMHHLVTPLMYAMVRWSCHRTANWRVATHLKRKQSFFVSFFSVHMFLRHRIKLQRHMSPASASWLKYLSPCLSI